MTTRRVVLSKRSAPKGPMESNVRDPILGESLAIQARRTERSDICHGPEPVEGHGVCLFPPPSITSNSVTTFQANKSHSFSSGIFPHRIKLAA